MGDEERFQTNIQSEQSWQLVTCGQGCCPVRAEHPHLLRFPGVAEWSQTCNCKKGSKWLKRWVAQYNM